jgi:hypothetical protein
MLDQKSNSAVASVAGSAAVTAVEQPQSPPKKKRLNLDLSADAHELLQRLADESGKNMVEVLRTGLAVYGIAHDERKKGRKLAVVQDDQIVKELVIP